MVSFKLLAGPLRIGREIQCLLYAGFFHQAIAGYGPLQSSHQGYHQEIEGYGAGYGPLQRSHQGVVLMVTHGETASCFTKICKVSRKNQCSG